MRQAPISGLCLSIASEFPNLNCLCIDLDAEQPANDPQVVTAIAREIIAPPWEDIVALRNGTRYVARLARARTGAGKGTDKNGLFPIHDDASYLITGGFGGIGLIMARWLADRGARHLVLTGRRGATEEARATLDALEEQGVHVYAGKADVAEREALQQVLEDGAASMPPLKGILHAAGVLDEGLLTQQDWGRFQKTLAPKVAGTWNLHELTCDIDGPVLLDAIMSITCTVCGIPIECPMRYEFR